MTRRGPAPGPAYAGRSKYDEPGRAQRYAARSEKRHRAEWALVEKALAKTPPPRAVLDVPCGAGRIAAEFLSRDVSVRCADLSPAMREAASQRLAGQPRLLGIEALDLEAPSPPDELATDLVVCFRFLHHLPDAAARARVLASLAALSKRHLLVSFHHPVSGHNFARFLRRVSTGRHGDRHTITVSRLSREAGAHGLRLVRAVALGAYRRELWVALFERAAR